jgi:hypothetical protein
VKGFSAHPETIWGETLDVIVAESDKAAARLRRAGVGATVRLTKHALKSGITVRGGTDATGEIVGWGNHRPYHARFWAPVRRAGKRNEAAL